MEEKGSLESLKSYVSEVFRISETGEELLLGGLSVGLIIEVGFSIYSWWNKKRKEKKREK